jgi:type IV secretion system protein VirB5
MRLFGGGQQRPIGELVAEAEGLPAEDQPESPLAHNSGRLRHLPAHLREMVPYFAGAVAHSERYGSLSQQARAYRLAVLVLAFGYVVMGAGVVRMALELADTRVVPYVVQVDSHGYVVPVGAFERAAPVDPRVVMASLARWIRALRTVTGEQHAQKALIEETFAFIGAKSTAAQKVNEWFAQHSPFDGSGRHVEVDIVRVAPLQSGTEFSIEWTEEATDAQGEHPEKSLYSAVVMVARSPTQKLADIIRNPLGVFVRDYSISKLQ